MRDKPFKVKVNIDPSNGLIDASRTEEVEFKISRIDQPPSFLPKGATPFLQLADACAFGIRSFLSGASHSEDYGRLLLGNHDDILDLRKPRGSVFGALVEWHTLSEPHVNPVPLPL
jgi:hypothetical protein